MKAETIAEINRMINSYQSRNCQVYALRFRNWLTSPGHDMWPQDHPGITARAASNIREKIRAIITNSEVPMGEKHASTFAPTYRIHLFGRNGKRINLPPVGTREAAKAILDAYDPCADNLFYSGGDIEEYVDGIGWVVSEGA